MEISRPDQITGPIARQMRENMGLTQKQFWGPFGINKSRASGYETEKHEIDEPIQLLVYLHHVCRFPVNRPHDAMRRIGTVINNLGEGFEALDEALKGMEAAVEGLKTVRTSLEDN